jgi:hypothetical protein
MKACFVIALALCVGLSMTAVAQDASKAAPEKGQAATTPAKSMEGTVKEEGGSLTFVSDKDQKAWTVDNPEVLKGHENHHVKIKAQVDAAKGTIHISDVKMSEAAKKDDMNK